MTEQKRFSGKSIHFTGELFFKPRYYAEELGVLLSNSVSEDVSCVVAGESPNSARIDQAKALGIEVLDEVMFLELSGLRDKWRALEEAVPAIVANIKRSLKEREEEKRARKHKRATM